MLPSLVYFIIVAIIIGFAIWAIDRINMDATFKVIVKGACYVILVIVVILLLLRFAGMTIA